MQYGVVLKYPNYRKLLSANFINRFGDCVDGIAFTWLTYTFTQSASLSAIVFAANMIPMLFQPLTAPIVDKLPKQKVMVISDFIRGGLLGIFILCYLLEVLQPWMFVAFTFFTNCAESFRIPAAVAYMPHFLEGKELELGLNLNQVGGHVCELAGTAIGGVLVAISPSIAMGIDLISFILSGLLIAWMKVNEVIDQTVKENDYWENLKAGFQYLGKNHKFLLFVLIGMSFNGIGAVVSGVIAAFINGVLHASAIYLSVSNIITTICTLVMLLAYPKLSKKMKPSFVVSFFAFGSMAFLYLILSVLPMGNDFMKFVGWVLSFVVFGLGGGLFSAYVNIMFVKVVDKAYLSRAAGVYNACVTMISPIVATLLAGIVTFVSIPVVFLWSGILCLVFMLIFGLSKTCKLLNEEE